MIRTMLMKHGIQLSTLYKCARGKMMHRIAILSPTTSQADNTNAQADRESSPDGIDTGKRPRTFTELATELKNLETDFSDTQNLPNVLELLLVLNQNECTLIASNLIELVGQTAMICPKKD